jgi:mono/diheme cytochrome c family protein
MRANVCTRDRIDSVGAWLCSGYNARLRRTDGMGDLVASHPLTQRNVLMRHVVSTLWAARTFSILAPLMFFACSSSTDNSMPGDVTAGKEALTKYACQSCHGPDLSGTTTPFAGTAAYPANLTPDKDTGLGDWDMATIKTAILTGTDDEGETLCSTMPVFQKVSMTDAEATNIAAYLQSLPAVKKDIPESKCSNGSAGSGGAAGSAAK